MRRDGLMFSALDSRMSGPGYFIIITILAGLIVSCSLARHWLSHAKNKRFLNGQPL